MRRALAELLPRFGAPVLQAEYTQLAVYRPDILVEHDITWDLYQQVHSREQSLSSWWNLYRWRRFERKALRGARRVVIMSEKDRELAATPRAVVVPNGVDLDRFRPSPETPGRRLLFVGSFRHFPNLVAFRFFLEEIWPRLKDVSLTVVGGPGARQYADSSGLAPLPAGVTLHEFVGDVVPLYREANLAVVPTLVSAGTNLKVLEAMAMRRAIVSTPSGCAGIGLVHRESAWIAESARSFAEGIELLLEDVLLRERVAAAARRLAERNYSWRKIGLVQRELLRTFSRSPLVIRAATEADLPSIARLQDASREASQWNPKDYLRHRVLVAQLGDAAVGFVAFREVAADEVEVLNLVVAPESRRQGVARRLMEAVMKQNFTNLFLEVRESNSAARKLYESLGLLVQGRRPHYYHDPPEDAIVMALRKC
jgi:ribosomal-protein-alanine acetyltransferase